MIRIFGHENILNFKTAEGNLLRKFSDIYHHDEFIISNWNKTVGPDDKVYHLGDVGFISFTKMKAIFDRLNGTKILIKGNHDNYKLSQYAQIFKDIRAYHVLDRFVLSHVPIHPNSLDRWAANIHGHLHSNTIDDPKYINICVEHTYYTPVDFEDIRRKYA